MIIFQNNMENSHLMTWFSRNCSRPEQDRSPDLHFRDRLNSSPNLLFSNSRRGAKEFLTPRKEESSKRSDNRRKQRQSRYDIFTKTAEEDQGDDMKNTFGDFYSVCAGIEGKQKTQDECHTNFPYEFESVYSPLNMPSTGLVFRNNEGIPTQLGDKELISEQASSRAAERKISSKNTENQNCRQSKAVRRENTVDSILDSDILTENTVEMLDTSDKKILPPDIVSPSSFDINITSEPVKKNTPEKSAEKITSEISNVESNINRSEHKNGVKEKERGAENCKQNIDQIKSETGKETCVAPVNQPLTNEVVSSTDDAKGVKFKNISQKSHKAKIKVLHVEKLMPQLDTYREGATLRLKSHISGYALKMSVGVSTSRARLVLGSWSKVWKRKLPTSSTKDKEESKPSLVRKLLDMFTFKCCRTKE